MKRRDAKNDPPALKAVIQGLVLPAEGALMKDRVTGQEGTFVRCFEVDERLYYRCKSKDARGTTVYLDYPAHHWQYMEASL